MALDLIGAGLGRTGTLSLEAALERIGYGPCDYVIEVLVAAERRRSLPNADSPALTKLLVSAPSAATRRLERRARLEGGAFTV